LNPWFFQGFRARILSDIGHRDPWIPWISGIPSLDCSRLSMFQ
jgi:hypothetical protein